MQLKPGDTLDIIAPSSFPKNNQWEKGLKILKTWGLNPRFNKQAISPWLFHSNSNKKRSNFLNQAFLNRDSSAVWMLRGGYGLQKLMPSFIKNCSKKFKKKLFIGYSDGTALHLYLNSQNLTTLQAPVISELPSISKNKLALLKTILFGTKKEIAFDNLKVSNKIPEQNLKAEIIGGNLSLLSSCVGLPWLPSFKSHFLFIEDVNEEDYKVDRLLHHLFYSGSLKGVRAILFGSFYPLNNHSLRTKVLKSFSDVCNIPMVFGLPCGHKPPHHPLPLKTPAELIIQKDKAILKVKLRNS